MKNKFRNKKQNNKIIQLDELNWKQIEKLDKEKSRAKSAFNSIS